MHSSLNIILIVCVKRASCTDGCDCISEIISLCCFTKLDKLSIAVSSLMSLNDLVRKSFGGTGAKDNMSFSKSWFWLLRKLKCSVCDIVISFVLSSFIVIVALS